MWKPYAEEYGTSMYELTGQPPSRGRMMYMKQQAGYELPHNELRHAPTSQKFMYHEPKTVKHTSQMVDVYVNPQHMIDEDRPKRRTVSPSRPKVQSKELLTGKRGSRAAEMFVRAREHTDQHVTDQEKVAKRRQARKYSPWEATVGNPTLYVDETYEEPVPKKFQNITSPSIQRKSKPQTRSIEQVDYSYSYSNGYQPRTKNPWKSSDSERLKRFHSEVEPYKMNYNRAPTGWANSSECSDHDAFDLGSLDAQLPKGDSRMLPKKTRQGRLRDFNPRPKSWAHDYDEEENEEKANFVSAETVHSRRVQFEEYSRPKSPRLRSRNSNLASKFRPVAGPKKWSGLLQSEDL